LNSIDLSPTHLLDGRKAIGFRYSRLNHSCDPNAHPWEIEGTKNLVLYSARPIKTGDEICMTYLSVWADWAGYEETVEYYTKFLIGFRRLELKWGIFCPTDCVCKDLNVLALIAEFSRLSKFASEGDVEASLAAAKERIFLCITQPRMIGNLALKQISLLHAFSAAMKVKKKANEAMIYIKGLKEIIDQFEFPGSVKSLLYKSLCDEQPWLKPGQGTLVFL
jgi:hypothetical protein